MQARRIVYWRWKTNLTRITRWHDAQLRALRRERRCGAGCGTAGVGAAIRTAEGGAEHVQPITGDNIVNVLDDFRQAGYTVVTTSSEQGKPLFKTSLPAKMVLVLGQEYEGLPDAARDPNDLRVKIDGTGNVAGLNISVATGVLLGEWWRQNKA